MKPEDVLFVNPGDHRKVFQQLGKNFAAIEPPAMAGLLAGYFREKEYGVDIIDGPGSGMAPTVIARAVAARKPLLTVVVVYGHQPSASTQNMPAAREICELIKALDPAIKILLTGTHPAALPERTMREEAVDFVAEVVCQTENFSLVEETVAALKSGEVNLSKVGGLWYREGTQIMKPTRPAKAVEQFDDSFPKIAWDMLPMKNYRAHNWHCFDNLKARQPYAALHTTFGCPWNCSFCCIPGRNSYRMLPPEYVIQEIDTLVKNYGVRNIKIIDEMFVLNRKHVTEICEKIIERGYDLNMWSYARVDTVSDRELQDIMRRAGVTFEGIGIESGSKHVRDGADKDFKNRDIIEQVRKVQEAGINVGANYIFGLPDDTVETMQQTLDLAMEINSEWANFYCFMPYPGADLYPEVRAKGWFLPEDPGGPGWIGYSQHAYEIQPVQTEHLSAKEVLRFRDDAFHAYFENPQYVNMIREKFGPQAAAHINEMTNIRLKRKLLED